MIDLLFSFEPIPAFERAAKLNYLTSIQKYLELNGTDILQYVSSEISPRIFVYLLQQTNFTPLIEDVLQLATQVDLDLFQFRTRGIDSNMIESFIGKNIIEENYEVVKLYLEKYHSLLDDDNIHSLYAIAILTEQINVIELLFTYIPLTQKQIYYIVTLAIHYWCTPGMFSRIIQKLEPAEAKQLCSGLFPTRRVEYFDLLCTRAGVQNQNIRQQVIASQHIYESHQTNERRTESLYSNYIHFLPYPNKLIKMMKQFDDLMWKNRILCDTKPPRLQPL